MARTKRPDHPRREAANLTRTLAVQALRRSGAAGKHAQGTRRERTRGAAQAADIRVNGWS